MKSPFGQASALGGGGAGGTGTASIAALVAVGFAVALAGWIAVGVAVCVVVGAVVATGVDEIDSVAGVATDVVELDDTGGCVVDDDWLALAVECAGVEGAEDVASGLVFGATAARTTSAPGIT